MTPAEADQRIIKSRTTLARYAEMMGSGVAPAFGTITLVASEIALLEEIAEAHPGKADKIAYLVERWAALRDTLKARLH